jgi:hypothetical protein
MWNPFLFYLDLTGVYTTHGLLERLEHFLSRPIDGMRRRDQRVVDRQRRDAITIRCSECTQYQFAIDPHQTNAGIWAKSFADLLVALLDSDQQLGGIGTAHPSIVGKRTHGGTLIAGVQGDVEPELDLISGEIVDVVSVTKEFNAPFTLEDRGV